VSTHLQSGVATTSGAFKKPSLLRPYLIVSAISALLVLVLAVLGGQYYGGEPDAITIHGHTANALFMLVVVQAVLAFAMGAPGSLGRVLVGVGIATVVLTTAQIGIGYLVENNRGLIAIHIPNGVLIFGVAVFALAQWPRLKALATA
jgi:hypothetical protein